MGIDSTFYDRDYFEAGKTTGKSGYEGYHWDTLYKIIANELTRYFNPKCVLDIGCAKGYLVMELRNNGIETYGIDLSEYAIKNVPRDIRPYVYQTSATDIFMFQDSIFDLVIAYDILEHLDENELELAMKEIRRVSNKIVTIKAPFEHYDWDIDKSHIGIRSKDEWVSIFNDHGFARLQPLIPMVPYSFWDDRTLFFIKREDESWKKSRMIK